MKMISRVLEEAKNGSNTSEDISEVLGICVNRASSYASQLIALGMLRRTGNIAVNKYGMKILKVFEPVGDGENEATLHEQRTTRRSSASLSHGRI